MRTLNRVAVAVGVALAFTSPAAGGNWTVSGTASQRLEADSNFRLREDGEAIYGSVTGVDLDAVYDTRRTLWTLGTGIKLRGYGGPGDKEGLNGVSEPRLEGSVEHRRKTQALGADFTLRRRSTQFVEFEDGEFLDGDLVETEITERDATETKLNLGADWVWRLDPLNTLALGADAAIRRFSEDSESLTPSERWTVNARWGRVLDPRTQGGIGAAFTRFEADGVTTDTSTSVLRFSADVSRRPTKRHSISLAGGLGYSWTEQTEQTDFGAQERDDQGLSLSGSLGFAWQGAGGLSATTFASHSLEPGLSGTLRQTTRFGASLGRPLTPRSRASLESRYAHQTSSAAFGGDGSTSQLFSIGPRLDYSLTPDWEAGIGLDLRYRETDDGDARSARLFLEIRRPFILNR